MSESTSSQPIARPASDFRIRRAGPCALHGQLKFGAEDAFYRELRNRVDESNALAETSAVAPECISKRQL
jgi:hypothetical protein